LAGVKGWRASISRIDCVASDEVVEADSMKGGTL
jgi:hypothetical protein